MGVSLWLWGFLAVAVCWGVGVYNRLMRIQARGLAALRSVEKHMYRCTTLIYTHAEKIDERHLSNHPHCADAATALWAALMDSTHNLSQSLKDAKGTPLSSPLVTNLGLAFEAMLDAWRRSSSGQPESTGGYLVSEALRIEWESTTLRVQVAREGLNQIMSKYNLAITQFPASLLVNVMGFKPASLM